MRTDREPIRLKAESIDCFSAQNLEDVEHLASPQLRYIGLQPTDIEALKLPQEARLPLTPRDRALINTLSNKPCMQQNDLLRHQVRSQMLFLSVSRDVYFSISSTVNGVGTSE